MATEKRLENKHNNDEDDEEHEGASPMEWSVDQVEGWFRSLFGAAPGVFESVAPRYPFGSIDGKMLCTEVDRSRLEAWGMNDDQCQYVLEELARSKFEAGVDADPLLLAAYNIRLTEFCAKLATSAAINNKNNSCTLF